MKNINSELVQDPQQALEESLAWKSYAELAHEARKKGLPDALESINSLGELAANCAGVKFTAKMDDVSTEQPYFGLHIDGLSHGNLTDSSDQSREAIDTAKIAARSHCAVATSFSGGIVETHRITSGNAWSNGFKTLANKDPNVADKLERGVWGGSVEDKKAKQEQLTGLRAMAVNELVMQEDTLEEFSKFDPTYVGPDDTLTYVLYRVLDENYKADDNRPGNILDVLAIMPNKDAKSLLDAIRIDPTVMRDFIDKVMTQEMGITRDNWHNKPGLRPPYREWDEKSDGKNKIAIVNNLAEKASEATIIEFSV